MEKLIAILNEIKPGVDFTKEDNLIDSHILTSLDIVKLVVELSNEFDIEISPLEIVPENFKSATSIMALINKIENDD